MSVGIGVGGVACSRPTAPTCPKDRFPHRGWSTGPPGSTSAGTSAHCAAGTSITATPPSHASVVHQPSTKARIPTPAITTPAGSHDATTRWPPTTRWRGQVVKAELGGGDPLTPCQLWLGLSWVWRCWWQWHLCQWQRSPLEGGTITKTVTTTITTTGTTIVFTTVTTTITKTITATPPSHQPRIALCLLLFLSTQPTAPVPPCLPLTWCHSAPRAVTVARCSLTR